MSFNHGIIVFYSSVAGNTLWIKHTDRVEFLLTANKIQYTKIDVSTEPNALQYLRDNSQLKNNIQTPQIFKNGIFVGGAETIDEANEYGELRQLLGLDSTSSQQPTTQQSTPQPQPTQHSSDNNTNNEQQTEQHKVSSQPTVQLNATPSNGNGNGNGNGNENNITTSTPIVNATEQQQQEL